MKQQFFFKLLLLLFVVGSTSAKAQIVPTRYHIYTYNPADPHVNPFKKKGSDPITWAKHMQNVATDNLKTYMDPAVASYDKYLTEAAYCINFNRAFLGFTADVNLAQAQKVLEDSKGVLVTVPGGVMYVLGIDPSTGKVACFLNPGYTEVAMLEYTSPVNGNKIYVSKYSGADKECCINLIIDLQPRTGPTATVVHDLDTVYIDKTVFVHDQDVYNTNYYTEEVYETNYGGSWYPVPQPVYYGPGYYMMPYAMCQPVFGCQPTYRCNSGGIACAMVPATPENKSIIEIYITINNVNIINNNTVQVVHPDLPRPTPTTPLYNNTGGSGEQANNGGGGGDHPVVTTPTGNDNGGGAGDGINNDSGTGDGANNTGAGGVVGKKEADEQPYSASADLGKTAKKASTTDDSRPADRNIYNSSNEKKYVDNRFPNANQNVYASTQQRPVERTAQQSALPTRTVQQYLADQARARNEQLQAENTQQYSNNQPSPNYNQQYPSNQVRPNYDQQYQGGQYNPNYNQQWNNNGRTNYDNPNYRGNYGNQGNAQHGTTTTYDVNRTKPQVNYNQPKTNSYDVQRTNRQQNQPTGTSNVNVQRQQRPDVQRGGGGNQQMNAARPPMRNSGSKGGR